MGCALMRPFIMQLSSIRYAQPHLPATVADIRCEAGTVHWRMKNFTSAITHFEKALDTYKCRLGDKNETVLALHCTLGTVYLQHVHHPASKCLFACKCGTLASRHQTTLIIVHGCDFEV